MALFNYASKEITLKVVYYGPGLCGKTTNLQKLHATMNPDKKGKLLSLSTDADRTLFFDFMPVHLGKIKNFNIRFQLYTVPGQVRYNATRKLVLKGADAIVFVADSQKAMKEANIESFENMKENLHANNINHEDIPVILQYNKRDLKNIMTVAEMDADMNSRKDEIVEASAYEGWGVDETFQMVTKRLLRHISKKHNVQLAEPEDEAVMAKPSAKPAEPQRKAAEPGKKDQIHISVKDKANDLLSDDAPAAAAEGGTMDWTDLYDETKAAVDAEASAAAASEWDGAELELDNSAGVGGIMDIEPLQAEEVPEVEAEVVMEAESAEVDLDFAADTMIDDDILGEDFGGGDSSQLEQMLAEEEASQSPSAAGGASNGDIAELKQMIQDLVEEVREAKILQSDLLEKMSDMDRTLKMIMASRKKPTAPPQRP